MKCFQDHALGECEVLGKLSCHDENGLKQVPQEKGSYLPTDRSTQPKVATSYCSHRDEHGVEEAKGLQIA